MPDLIIKPAAQSGNKVIIQDQAGGAVITTADSGATMASNVTGIPAAGVTGVLPVGVTGGSGLTALGTVTSGSIGTSVVFPSFVGMIAPFAMTSPPAGWLACDGSAVSRTVTYSALFAALSTTWGVGDGSSTFNVPDLEGAFLRGTGSHATSNMYNGSDYAGPSVGAFTDDNTMVHSHATYSWGSGTTPTNPTNANAKPIQHIGHAGRGNTNWATPYTVAWTSASLSGSTWTGATSTTTNGMDSKGAYQGNETKPFNAGVKYCIKY